MTLRLSDSTRSVKLKSDNISAIPLMRNTGIDKLLSTEFKTGYYDVADFNFRFLTLEFQINITF